MIAFILANKALILGALWACSEILAAIPGIASNSVFQLVRAGLKKLIEFFKPAPAQQ